MSPVFSLLLGDEEYQVKKMKWKEGQHSRTYSGAKKQCMEKMEKKSRPFIETSTISRENFNGCANGIYSSRRAKYKETWKKRKT